jgi:hypothetical protein
MRADHGISRWWVARPIASVDAENEGSGSNPLRLESVLDPNGGRAAGDELVQILIRLALDVERFQEMVAVQQRALERLGPDHAAHHDDELPGQAQRLSLEAKHMATSARRALREIRRLSPAEGSDQLWLDRG